MKSSTVSDVSRLLDIAIELPPAERWSWLETLPPEYAALRPRLHALLAQATSLERSDFLTALPAFSDHTPEQSAGTALGPYRLLRELGRGGMGSVWLAERSDGLIQRQVALKLPHSGWDAPGFAERAAREREILATLTHPNIARLYDAGVTADGQPYLALEYVDGRRIDEYCQTELLDTKQRLHLFAQVVRAVAYAHAKLVVHRDLKPANVLVTPGGQAHLLDFGIAKIVHAGGERITMQTQFAGRVLTPDYASPEQVVGGAITIATDLYSLGVVLYELLTGVRPYKLARDTLGALEEAILQVEPAPPSAVTSGAPERRALRGDLDALILKLLKKDPAERYATANALLEDIERYLAGVPVQARATTRWYRARRFVARNKLAAGSAAAVLFAIVAGAGAAQWQARVALREAARAEQVKNYVASLFRDIDPEMRRSEAAVTAVELLHQARRRVDVELVDQPRVRVELLGIIGESYAGLEDGEAAADALQTALREAARAGIHDQKLLGNLHLLLARSYGYLGRLTDAVRESDQAITLLSAAGAAAKRELVDALLERGHQALDEGAFALAEAMGERALREVARSGADPKIHAQIHSLLAQVAIKQRRSTVALSHARRAYEITLDVHRHDLTHPNVSDQQVAYGRALLASGDPQSAVRELQTATQRAIATYGADGMRVGFFLGHLATAQIQAGELSAAAASARRSLEIHALHHDAGSTHHAGRLTQLGVALLAAGNAAEALRQFDQALTFAKQTEWTRAAQAQRGLALVALGRLGEAEAEFDAVLHGAELNGRFVHIARRGLGQIRARQGRASEALVHIEAAWADIKDRRDNPLTRAAVLSERGFVRLDLGQFAEAAKDFEQAIAICTAMQTSMTPTHADAKRGLQSAQLSLAAAL